MSIKKITQPGAFSPRTVETLEIIEDEMYTKYKTNCRPKGKTWVYMVLDLIREIVDREGLLESITEADLNQLTEENFHTMRTAAEIAIHLDSINIK